MTVRSRAPLLGRLGLLVLLVSAWTCGGTATPPEAINGQPSAVLYEGARLITGEEQPPIDDSAFLVDNGRIVATGRRGVLNGPDTQP